MSLAFGVYVSLLGVAVVFVTLLAVAATSRLLRRVLSEGVEMPQARARAAAIAATLYLMGSEYRSPRMVAAAEAPGWSAAARVEALGMRGERSR